jgi:hypothetical protein
MTRSFKIASSIKISLVIVALLIGLVVMALVAAYFYINSTLPRVDEDKPAGGFHVACCRAATC